MSETFVLEGDGAGSVWLRIDLPGDPMDGWTTPFDPCPSCRDILRYANEGEGAPAREVLCRDCREGLAQKLEQA